MTSQYLSNLAPGLTKVTQQFTITIIRQYILARFLFPLILDWFYFFVSRGFEPSNYFNICVESFLLYVNWMQVSQAQFYVQYD